MALNLYVICGVRPKRKLLTKVCEESYGMLCNAVIVFYIL